MLNLNPKIENRALTISAFKSAINSILNRPDVDPEELQQWEQTLKETIQEITSIDFIVLQW
jgi:hypothetical protein